MKRKTLIELASAAQRYLSVEHPEVTVSDEEVEGRLTLLYEQIESELGGVDAQLIRHKASMQLGHLDLSLEIEKIGLFSGFCLHIEQDKGMIAQWIEKEMIFD